MKLPKSLVSKLPDKDMQNAPIALLRAAKYARKPAQETGTAFVYVRNGKLIREIPKAKSGNRSRSQNHTFYPRVGVGVLVVRDEQFLLGKRIGTHMPGYYAAPGGHLEHGETFADCARREVLEETGLIVSKVTFLTIGNYMFGTKHYVDVDMLAEVQPGEPQVLEPQKCESWKWYSITELPSPLFVVTKNMIDAYIQGFQPATARIDSLDTQDL